MIGKQTKLIDWLNFEYLVINLLAPQHICSHYVYEARVRIIFPFKYSLFYSVINMLDSIRIGCFIQTFISSKNVIQIDVSYITRNAYWLRNAASGTTGMHHSTHFNCSDSKNVLFVSIYRRISLEKYYSRQLSQTKYTVTTTRRIENAPQFSVWSLDWITCHMNTNTNVAFSEHVVRKIQIQMALIELQKME